MARHALLCLLFVVSLGSKGLAQNLRGHDDPSAELRRRCDVPCDMGGCEFNGCNTYHVSCRGGGCTIYDSTKPKCEGGGCEFNSCEKPTCGGGGCRFYNSVGGDAPRTEEVIKVKKHATFGEMTPEEIEASFKNSGNGAAAESTPPPVAPMLELEGDTGDVDGFKVADPPNLSISHYETEKAELIKTGQGGVLDASWTVGGRVKGRENIEKEKQLRDLDRWAAELKAEAEKEVELARTEKKKREEESGRIRSEADQEIAQAKRDKERLEQEAQKAADLARQWKEYSEQVEAQAALQKQEAEEAKLQNLRLEALEEEVKRKEEKEKEKEKGKAEDVVVDEVDEGVTATGAKAEARGDLMYVYDADIAFVNRVQILMMLCAVMLTFYVITQTDILPVSLELERMDRIGMAVFFHTLFCQYYLIGTFSSLINPKFGAIAACASWTSGSEAVLLVLKLAYAGTVVVLFLAALGKAEWFCRLFQVCSLLVAADAKIQAAATCPMKYATLGAVMTPYLLGLALYVMSLLIELKIFESKRGIALDVAANEEGNWEAIQLMDDKLVVLLKGMLTFDGVRRKFKTDEEQLDFGAGLGRSGGLSSGGVGEEMKRRRQAV